MKKRLIIFGLLLFSALRISAVEDTYENFIQGNQFITGAITGVMDPLFPWINGVSPYENINALGRIGLSLDHLESTYIDNYYQLDAECMIWVMDQSGNPIPDNFGVIINLSLEYDPLGDINTLDNNFWAVPGAHSIRVNVLSMTTTDENGQVSNINTAHANARLYSQIDVERCNRMDINSITPSNIFAIDQLQENSALDNEEDLVHIRWNAIDGAEYYDLEWTFITDYELLANGNIGVFDPAEIDVDENLFRTNSTRVSIVETEYKIPHIFERGWLIYRLRPVGCSMQQYPNEIFGRWTSENFTCGNLSCFTNALYIDENSVQQRNKNWQYSSQFAEEGKRKSVVSYFDGSLRNRQTVTHMNTDNTTIVGQTIYDAQGRPSINILPVPDGRFEGEALTYHSNFNTIDGNNVFHWNHFDTDNGDCENNSISMSNITGASNYYSDQNPNLSDFHRNLPEANGFPYSIVKYTPDNTGRIKEQTGIGEDHNLNSGHTTQYFYDQPYQEQLNRLFGNNAGYASHYKRNAVIDPNGQVSISYLDMAGNVVATALAGENPENLNALTVTGASTPLHEEMALLDVSFDLLNKSNSADVDTDTDSNHLSPDGKSLTAERPFFVEFEGEHTFSYNLFNEHHQAPCLDTEMGCFKIVYDLDLSLEDDCGTDLAAFAGSYTIGDPSAIGTQFCNGANPNDFEVTSPDLTLGIGNYTISKELSINEEALENYAQAFLEYLMNENSGTNCYLTYEDFWNLYAPSAEDLAACNSSCQDCYDGLINDYAIIGAPVGTDPSNFTVAHAQLGFVMEYYDGDILQITPEEEEFFHKQFDELLNSCLLPCQEPSICENAYGMMLADVSPYGQYGAIDNSNEQEFKLSVFNSGSGANSNLLPPLTFSNNNAVSTSHWKAFAANEDVYFEEDGSLSLIPLTWDGSIFLPENDLSTPIEINGNSYCKPQDLTHLEDFIANWQNAWAETLVQFHPEYCYLSFCADYMPDNDGQNLGVTEFLTALNSNNDYLNGISITTPYSTFSLDMNNVQSFIDADPFFDNNFSAFSSHGYTNAESIFINNLADYNGTGESILDLSIITALCGTWYGSDAESNPNSPCNGAQLNNLSAEEQEEVWNTFRGLYIAKRNELVQNYADLFAADPNIGLCQGYNGCIGAEDGVGNSFLSNFPSIDLDFDIPGDIASGVDQACNSILDQFFANGFAPRFTWSFPQNTNACQGDMNQLEELEATVDYNMYVQSGVCPLENDILNLIAELHNEQELLSTQSIPFHSAQFMDIEAFSFSFFEFLNPLANLNSPFENWNLEIALNTDNIEIQFDDGNGPVGPTFTLYNYNPNINAFIEVQQSNPGYFEILTEIAGVEHTLILVHDNAGISDCSADFAQSNPSPSFELLQLKNVMNHVISSTDAITNDFDLGSNSNIFFPNQNYWLMPFHEHEWISSSPSVYILDQPASVYDIVFENGVGDIAFIYNIYPIQSTSYNFQIEYLATDGSCKSVSGSFDHNSNPVNTGEVNATPENLLCDTPENHNLLALEQVLDNIANTGWYSVNIVDDFPYTLRNHLSSSLNAFDNVFFGVSIDNSNNLLEAEFFMNGGELCELELEFLNPEYANSSANIAYTFEDIVGLNNLYAIEQNTDGTFAFSVLAELSDGNSWTLMGNTCFPIQNCESCFGEEDYCLTGNEAIGTTVQDGITILEGVAFHAAINCWGHPIGINQMNAHFAYYKNHSEIFNPISSAVDEYNDYLDLFDMLWNYNADNYFNYIQNGGVSVSEPNGYISFEDFGNNGYEHYFDAYQILATSFFGNNGVNDWINSPLFISIQDFAANGLSEQCVEQYLNGYYPQYLAGLDQSPNPVPQIPVNEFCGEYPKLFPCGNGNILDFVNLGTPPEEPEDPCEKLLNEFAQMGANQAFEEYVENLVDNFKNEYIEFAMSNVVENFSHIKDEKEYHYTLYYYDQAGNLVQTVPPEGVDRIDIYAPFTDAANADVSNVHEKINADRDDNLQNASLQPNHELQTRYDYNSLNQLTWQSTPDGGESHFYYDPIGRLVVSQNAKQADPLEYPEPAYSYTSFDELGRIQEVGQVLSNYDVPAAGQNGTLESFLNTLPGSSEKEQVTRTYYDDILEQYIADAFEDGQNNLRNRVATSTYELIDDGIANTFDAATHYSYDIHGNVSSVLRQFPDLAIFDEAAQTNGQDLSIQFKRTDYSYDLISGNVLEVAYETGEMEEYYHRYAYDADNRLTYSESSRDGLLWEKDSEMDYYKHGPLARTEIGERKIQGCDYAYTIQGWLKAVNSDYATPGNDMGRDGATTNQNQFVARDAYGFSLGYFEGDYSSVDPITNFLAQTAGSVLDDPSRDLFNGNISHMVTQIPEINALNNGDNHATYYHYDQLNRINLSMAIADNNLGDGWNGATALPAYRTDFSYDGNGNLMNLRRFGDMANLQMDDLNYHYIAGTNRLDHVTDAFDGQTATEVDIEGQSTGNYQYDAIGNLIADESEGIQKIHWLNNGKIEAIERFNDGSTTAPDLEFRYDPEGNRVLKIEKPRNETDGLLRNQSAWVYTYYFRDAQGNVLSTATRTFNELLGNTVQDIYALNDYHIYGSKRLGVELSNEIVAEGNRDNVSYVPGIYDNDFIFSNNQLASINTVAIPVVAGYHEKNIGVKRYEMSNHLGNVLAVLSDHHEANDGGTVTQLAFYNGKVMSASDYYPFGMTMPGRNFQGDGYRYGFQGQEQDNEVKGAGNSVNYKYRMHDPRIGKFLSIDPLAPEYPFYSPYAFSGNRVIDAYELEGLEPVVDNTGKLTGYDVQERQGPSQVAADINNPETQRKHGYTLNNDVDWVNIVFNNEQYFTNVPLMGTYNPNEIEYTRLNMNTGDRLDLSFVNTNSKRSEELTVTEREEIDTSTETALGLATGALAELYYSQAYGTWMGKNFKLYSQTWGGNGFTGGKLKFGKKINTGLKVGGYGLGALSAYNTWDDYQNGVINDYSFYSEQISNGISTFGGIYGVAWGIGWEAGRLITNTETFKEAKFNFWYNQFESEWGAPAEWNENIWADWFRNYRP